MPLTGPEIRRETTWITIDPFKVSQVGPNSYDVTLGDTLLVYDWPWWKRWFAPWACVLDSRSNQHRTREIKIPPEGLVLRPGILYLGVTRERIGSNRYRPLLCGRSSGGRLSIEIHRTAGYGDVGFFGYWTLEIAVLHRVRVYAGMKIGQVEFEQVIGEIQPYTGKYQNQGDKPVPSMGM